MQVEQKLIQSSVSIYNVKNRLSGTGFVVSQDGLIVTCAHVLEAQTKPETVMVVFRATNQQVQASVELFAANEDIVLLRVHQSALPPDVQVLPLGFSKNTFGHPVLTFGYPKYSDMGLWGKGEISGQTTFSDNTHPALQISSQEVTSGYSGAPVWDILRQQIVAIAKEITLSDRGRLEQTFMAIPIETLYALRPDIGPSLLECPYRELDIFTKDHSRFFFGREEVVDTLVASLRRDARFLAVFGPSGSGKSSVVRAGLLPCLQEGKVPGSNDWEVVLTHPAPDPFRQLKEAFSQTLDAQVTNEVQELTDMWLSQDLVGALRDWLDRRPRGQSHLLLIVDQFEELFSSALPEALRIAFVKQVTQLLSSDLSPQLTLLLVMRNDFYSQFMRYRDLADLLTQYGRQYDMPSDLSRKEILTIISKPAEAVGFRFEDHLEDRIVTDAMRSSSSLEQQSLPSSLLPLLEVTLTQLWGHCQFEGLLTQSAYEVVTGGTYELTYALRQKAEEAYLKRFRDDRQRSLVTRIFVDLIHVGDLSLGVPDVRESKTVQALAHREDEVAEVQAVAQQLLSARLLTVRVEMASAEGQQSSLEGIGLTIIHEALIRTWPRLRGWVESNRTFRGWQEGVERAMKEWEQSGYDDDELLHNVALVEAKRWLRDRGSELTDRHRDYIFHSILLEEGGDLKQWLPLYSEAGGNVFDFLDVNYLRSQSEAKRRKGIEALQCLPSAGSDERVYCSLQELILNDSSDAVRDAAALAICDIGHIARLTALLSPQQPPRGKRRLVEAIASVCNQYGCEAKVNEVLRHQQFAVRRSAALQLIRTFQNEIAITIFFALLFYQVADFIISNILYSIEGLLKQQENFTLPFDFITITVILIIGLYSIIRRNVVNKEQLHVKDYVSITLVSCSLVNVLAIITLIYTTLQDQSLAKAPLGVSLSDFLLNVLTLLLPTAVLTAIIFQFLRGFYKQQVTLLSIAIVSVAAPTLVYITNTFLIPFLNTLEGVVLSQTWNYTPVNVEAIQIYGLLSTVGITFFSLLGFRFGYFSAFVHGKRSPSIARPLLD